MSDTIQLYDTEGRRLYLSSTERDAFLEAATKADRPIRTLCSVLYYTGCRVSEALALISRRIDINDQTLIFETLKKRRTGVYRAIPVPKALLLTPWIWCTASERPTGGRKRMSSMRSSGRGHASRLGGRCAPS